MVGSYLLLSTAWGREHIRERINRTVSDGMQGKLEIGEIVEIDLPRVMARRVRILAPDGVAAIDVERADIDFKLSSFLFGNFIWHRADIHDGVVRVTEDKRGRVNMEETFKARRKEPAKKPSDKDSGVLDMRTMVTSNIKLEIHGGELPTLRLVDLHGVMRVHVAPDGTTDIRFDDYRGLFAKGLPHGQLKFNSVKGHVQTGHKRLLRFEGKGLLEQARVIFELDIFTEPKTRVLIDAHFPELSKEEVSTRMVGAWSKLAGDGLELKVHGKK